AAPAAVASADRFRKVRRLGLFCDGSAIMQPGLEYLYLFAILVGQAFQPDGLRCLRLESVSDVLTGVARFFGAGHPGHPWYGSYPAAAAIPGAQRPSHLSTLGSQRQTTGP